MHPSRALFNSTTILYETLLLPRYQLNKHGCWCWPKVHINHYRGYRKIKECNRYVHAGYESVLCCYYCQHCEDHGDRCSRWETHNNALSPPATCQDLSFKNLSSGVNFSFRNMEDLIAFFSYSGYSCQTSTGVNTFMPTCCCSAIMLLWDLVAILLTTFLHSDMLHFGLETIVPRLVPNTTRGPKCWYNLDWCIH